MPDPYAKYQQPASDPYAKYQTPATTTSAQVDAPGSGAMSRFGTSAREAVGIPSNPIQDLTQGVSYSIDNPGSAAKQLALSPVEAYKSAVTQQEQRMIDSYKKGDYGSAALHALYYLLAPIGGANLGKASEQAKSGDIAGSLGTTLGTALPAALGNPEARSNLAVPINAIRNPIATGLEKSAAPLSTAAAVATTGHELLAGHPYEAMVTAALGKPAISRLMKVAAQAVRPGDPGLQPLGFAPGFNGFSSSPFPEDSSTPTPKLSVDRLLKKSMDALDKKYPGTRAAWEASKQEAPAPTQDIVGLLQKSIAAAKSK